MGTPIDSLVNRSANCSLNLKRLDCDCCGDVGGYVLRVFASGPVNLEKVPPMHMQCRGGEWAKSSSMDTTGGPPRVLVGGEEGGSGL